MAKWYAAVWFNEDNDWGHGSHDLEEAKMMALKLGPESKVIVIEDGSDPIATGEINPWSDITDINATAATLLEAGWLPEDELFFEDYGMDRNQARQIVEAMYKTLSGKKYRIRDSFLDDWFAGMSTDEIDQVQKAGLPYSEIERLAREWDTTAEELMEQVEEI